MAESDPTLVVPFRPLKPPPPRADEGFTNDWLRGLRVPPGVRWEFGDGGSGRQPYLRLRVAGLPGGVVSMRWGVWLGRGNKRLWVPLGQVNLGAPQATGKLLTVAQAAAGARRLWEANHNGNTQAAIEVWREEHGGPSVTPAVSPKPSILTGTVKEAFEEFYLLRIVGGEKRRRRPEDVRRMFDKRILPTIGVRSCLDAGLEGACRDIVKRIARKAPVRAGHVLQTLKQFFAWARRMGYLTVPSGAKLPSPVEDLLPEDMGAKRPKKRSRWLTDVELHLLWHGLDKSGIDPITIWALRLLMVVPVRTGSLLQAERKEIDRERKVWSIPCEHLKLSTAGIQARGGQPLDIPLSEIALEIIEQLIVLGGNSRWLVPSPKNRPRRDEHMSDKALALALRRLLKSKRLVLPGNPQCPGYGGQFTPHDLRRTLRTLMSRLHLSREIAERCLGHVVAETVEATYDRWGYVDEMREALEEVGAHVRGVVTDHDIVSVLSTPAAQ